jgi:signal transduction histidine kinase
MLSNLKVKISLWYTLLLTMIIAGTLFSISLIVGYQMKSEITANLGKAEKSTIRVLRDTELSHGESEEHSHHERERNQSHESDQSLPCLSIRSHTEMLDDNYLLAVLSQNNLLYITERYRAVSKELFPLDLPENQIRDAELNELQFSITSIRHMGTDYLLGYEMSSISELQNKMIKIFIIVFPIGILLSFICGFIVTQGTMKVIRRINETTKNISSKNLDHRIEVPRGNDEVTHLIITLNSMFDRLEKAFSQSKQFSQDAAHEIRTPLTIIKGEVEELMERNVEDLPMVNKLENILEEIQYMSSISEKLLLIHTLDTGKIKYHFEQVDISQLLKDICQDAVIISAGKSIKIDNEIEPGIKLTCNKELMTRLMWNLIDNAIKYNKEKGSIRISLGSLNQDVRLQITDSGIGIQKEEIQHIFNRFYRVDKSRSRGLGGSGLGLAISKWIVDLHNGSITVESELNRGSTFMIALPR